MSLIMDYLILMKNKLSLFQKFTKYYYYFFFSLNLYEGKKKNNKNRAEFNLIDVNFFQKLSLFSIHFIILVHFYQHNTIFLVIFFLFFQKDAQTKKNTANNYNLNILKIYTKIIYKEYFQNSFSKFSAQAGIKFSFNASSSLFNIDLLCLATLLSS